MRRHARTLDPSLLVLAGALTALLSPAARAQPAVRASQVGYLPEEPKLAVIRSAADLAGQAFSVVARRDGSAAYSGNLSADEGAWSGSAHHHRADFSALAEPGVYLVRLATGEESYPFRIAHDAYNGLPSLILRHLRQQRCGGDRPLLHGPCHLDDGRVEDGPMAGSVRDTAGGWHDAGDYLKFSLTASHTTLFLLLQAEEHPEAFEDEDGDGLPEVLDEARHGLLWLEKMWDGVAGVLYTQVGGIEDHDEGWRLPEDDRLVDRPVWSCAPGAGANIAGKMAACFALAARQWGRAGTPWQDPAAAQRWRMLAEELYLHGTLNEGVDGGRPTWLYQEDDWADDMELAAVELHRLTGDPIYLDDARSFAELAGPAWWFNWSAVNALAHRELARIEPDPIRRDALLAFIREDLDSFESEAASNPLHVAVPYVWGSADAQMGAAFVASLWKGLTGDASHDALGADQLHYVLGANQWGACWLVGAGSDWPDDLHNQIDFLTGETILGAFAEGGITEADFLAEGITLDAPDEYASFQSPTAVYHDDTADYTTNEPTTAGDCSLLALLAQRQAPDRTLLMVKREPGDPGGALLRWTGESASYDVFRKGGPQRVETEANRVAMDLDPLEWRDAGPTPSPLTCYGVRGAR